MQLQVARELVVQAGKELIASGLIARTWGNVSCRISEDQIVITPSGYAYETLLPEETVVVNLADLRYEGTIKPSSELGVHAEAYRMRPDIQFVIHTHQTNASIVSAIGDDIRVEDEESAAIIGQEIKCAAYGLPGTGKLRRAVAAALQASPAKAVIMANHGALCLGKDYDDAFLVAHELEKVCEQHVLQSVNLSGRPAGSQDDLMDSFLVALGKKGDPAVAAKALHSRRQGDHALFDFGNNQVKFSIKTGQPVGEAMEAPPETIMHLAIYRERGDINYIIHSMKPELRTFSQAGITLKPLLDDLAQIAGVDVKNVIWDATNLLRSARQVEKGLKGRHAVFIANAGALCCGADPSDAHAVEMILTKGCKTYIGAWSLGKITPIKPLDSLLMRMVYLRKYSQIARRPDTRLTDFV